MAIAYVNERDMDMLLAEEFSVSPDFAAWFLGQTKFSSTGAHVTAVYVSKADSTGESDLEIVYEKAGGERIAVLIEDKIDAVLQPEQEARYRQRADAEKARGEFSDYEVILCSPQKYYDAHQDEVSTFDAFVSYEAITGFLKSLSDPRSAYKASLVSTAIEKSTGGWVRVDDPETNEFWRAAYKIANDEFPELEMREPRYTKGSSWICFRPKDMPATMRLELKCHLGNADLTFYNTAFPSFLEKLPPLDAGMSPHQAGKSSVIRIKVEPFEVSAPDEAALAKVRGAFESSRRLINFYRRHRNLFSQAAAL